MPSGMNRTTGKRLNESAQLLQSIQIILSTPLGSRVMRPDFGSELYNLVDAPLTDTNKLRIYKATIEALNKMGETDKGQKGVSDRETGTGRNRIEYRRNL